MSNAPRVLFQDMAFVVTDHGPQGVEVAFTGSDQGEETSGSKWYLDAAGEQVREICSRPAAGASRVARGLEKLTGIVSPWQVLDRGETIWSREGAEYMIRVVRENGSTDDEKAEYWVQTLDDDGHPAGPRATHEVFDAVGAREEASALCLPAAIAPKR